MAQHSFGWHPSIPDKRDEAFHYRLHRRTPAPSVDLTLSMPPVYDQGQLGSCVANALCGLMEFDRLRQGETDIMYSRLYNYYETRVIEHTVHSDAGCEIRDAVRSAAKTGICHESLWPYDIDTFTNKPTKAEVKQAKSYTSLSYHALNQDAHDLQGALTDGNPFIFGFTVYESFESDIVTQTGIVPMPSPGEGVLGGHAVVCVGYDTNNYFIVRNSWGTDWGLSGYFKIPFAYLFDQNLAGDMWVVATVK